MKQPYEELIGQVRLLPPQGGVGMQVGAFAKQSRNLDYLMELETRNLLFSYYYEAGIHTHFTSLPKDTHGGWDNPLSPIRGTFTGHWLSAAARLWQQTGDASLKAKADHIVAEIGRCQEANGGEWAFPIPEKYLYGLKAGQHYWAPQYVCHKAMMGLLDMHVYAGNSQALDIVLGCARWFTRFVADIDDLTMERMMQDEETGGIMELWADLYALTGDADHLHLMRRYERRELTRLLLAGEDALTNMHANATIPEMHGCARAYEVTGEERYRRIVEAYWDLAVTRRGTFATGGQTDAEIYTPLQQQAARLSELNQEHCVVYNLIRLANYLLRWTGESRYADYIERNIHNGLYAQGYWQARTIGSAGDPAVPDTGLVAYFLPLAAGSQKHWGSRTQDFWCCHCTLVQANARYREWIYYQSEETLTVAQYLPSQAQIDIGGGRVRLSQQFTNLSGENLQIAEAARRYPSRPTCWQIRLRIEADAPTDFTLRLRLPWWLQGEATLTVNGQETPLEAKEGYAVIRRAWHQDEVTLTLPKGLTCWPLPDRPGTVAFLDGPVVLAGLVAEERTLYGDKAHPETFIAPAHEREWTHWLTNYRTIDQPVNFALVPLSTIGRETYTVYFPVKNSPSNP